MCSYLCCNSFFAYSTSQAGCCKALPTTWTVDQGRAEHFVTQCCYILISLLYTVAWFDVQMCRKWCGDTSALLLIADRPTAQLNSVAVLRDGARPGAPHCLSIQKWSLTSSSCRPRYCLRSFPCGLWLAVGYSILLQVASCLLFSIHLLLLLLIRSRR